METVLECKNLTKKALEIACSDKPIVAVCNIEIPLKIWYNIIK